MLLNPHMVVGDLDSISLKGKKYIEDNKIKLIKYPSIKDATDTEIAIDYLLDKGYREIVLMGVTGTRLDHTMANIFLLDRIKNRGGKGKIIDDNNIIQLLEKEMIIEGEKNSYLSIIPLGLEGVNISLEGFYYDLDRANINYASTITISNRLVKERGKVSLHSGNALIFYSWD